MVGNERGEAVTFPEFDKFQEELLKEVVVMKDTKGKEYAHSEDRFANFNRLAEGLNLPNTQIAWVYTMKHKDSIESYLRGGYKGTEPIRGRIVDLITYLTLIAGMIEESRPTLCQLPADRPTILEDANSGKQQPFEYDPTSNALSPAVRCTKCGIDLAYVKLVDVRKTSTGLAHINCPKDPS